jgi:hypothetical protein
MATIGARATLSLACVFLLALTLSTPVQAQQQDTLRTNVPSASPAAADTAAIQERIAVHVEQGLSSKWHSVRDSLFYTKYNKYGDLKDDNPAFNPKQPWWVVGLKITFANSATTGVDHYVLRYDYARVGVRSWKDNFAKGWEWDVDRFGMNFLLHPYSGAGYYNSALSSGYSFYESIPFAVAGSLMYEYLGETTRPSINDFVNTPVSGAFFGAILYRLSSNILDDRTTGSGRFFRELAAAAVDPTRALGRLTSGQTFRHTSQEIYQKEPLNATLSSGMRRLNVGSRFGTGRFSATLNLDVDYGNPFEIRSRKPYDYFKMRADVNVGVGRKLLDNVTGLGILVGNNVKYGPLELLVGLFQHYDYWDNKTFELGTIAFGPGVVSKMPLILNSTLYTSLHVGVVPLAGNSTMYGPDTSQFRDYNYGGGLGGKAETTLELGQWASATFVGYYFWIHTYIGHKGDHYMAIIRPRAEFRVINNLRLGFEQLAYYSDRYPSDFHAIHFVQTEQRVYLKLYFDQFKRKE